MAIEKKQVHQFVHKPQAADNDQLPFRDNISGKLSYKTFQEFFQWFAGKGIGSGGNVNTVNDQAPDANKNVLLEGQHIKSTANLWSWIGLADATATISVKGWLDFLSNKVKTNEEQIALRAKTVNNIGIDANGNISLPIPQPSAAAPSIAMFGGLGSATATQTLVGEKLVRTNGELLLGAGSGTWLNLFNITGGDKMLFVGRVATDSSGTCGYNPVKKEVVTQSGTAGTFNRMNIDTLVSASFTIAGLSTILQWHKIQYDSVHNLLWLSGKGVNRLFAVNADTYALVYDIALAAGGNITDFILLNGINRVAITHGNNFSLINTQTGGIVVENTLVLVGEGGISPAGTQAKIIDLGSNTIDVRGYNVSVSANGFTLNKFIAPRLIDFAAYSGIQVGNKRYRVSITGFVNVTDAADKWLGGGQSIGINAVGQVYVGGNLQFCDYSQELGVVFFNGATGLNALII